MDPLKIEKNHNIPSASWHPSRDVIRLHWVNHDNGMVVALDLDRTVMDILTDHFAKVKEAYRPWIEENFNYDPMAKFPDTWQCVRCLAGIVARAEDGGLIYQMKNHLHQEHGLLVNV